MTLRKRSQATSPARGPATYEMESVSSASSQPPGLSAATSRSRALSPSREVDQNGAGMHEVKGSPLEFVDNDVVATHFEIRKVERFQKARGDIGGHHAPGWAYSLTEPFCYRAAAADLQAVPPLAAPSTSRAPRWGWRSPRVSPRASGTW
jgi:hypothetical protein